MHPSSVFSTKAIRKVLTTIGLKGSLATRMISMLHTRIILMGGKLLNRDEILQILCACGMHYVYSIKSNGNEAVAIYKEDKDTRISPSRLNEHVPLMKSIWM